MTEAIQKLKSADPELYNALKVLVDRLTPDNLAQEIAKSTTPNMKIGQLHSIIFSGQKVKIVHQGEVVFRGWANELPYCFFKECEVKTITTGYNDNTICIVIKKVINPKEG